MDLILSALGGFLFYITGRNKTSVLWGLGYGLIAGYLGQNPLLFPIMVGLMIGYALSGTEGLGHATGLASGLILLSLGVKTLWFLSVPIAAAVLLDRRMKTLFYETVVFLLLIPLIGWAGIVGLLWIVGNIIGCIVKRDQILLVLWPF